MSSHLQEFYETHHSNQARGGFSILEVDRGELFSRCIGIGKTVLDIGCRDCTLTEHFDLVFHARGVKLD